MEKFSCAVDTNYATHKSYVEKTCFSLYDDAFNSPVRFYAFVVLSYGSVIVVSVVYSLAVGNHIDETERYSSGSDEPQTVNEPGRKTFYVFYFYFIHLVVRSLLGILFTILQHTVLYPSGFDSQFSCVYPELRQADHNITAVKNTSTIQPNVTCTASTAPDKQFWGKCTSACNVLFAIITLLEVAYLIGCQFPYCFNAQFDAAWSCDLQFITEYFFRKQYVPKKIAINIYKQNILRDSLTSDINYGPCKSLDDMFIEVVIQTGRTSPKFKKPIQRHEMYDVYMKVPEHSICLEEIKDLFYPEKDTDGKFPQTILALGRPGIGKTVLSRKIRCDWAKGDVEFYHGKIAFFIKFRWFGFEQLQNITLKKFLQFGTELNEDQFESVFEEIWKNPQNAILIFDGLDECGCNCEKFQNLQDQSRMVSSDPSCPMSPIFLFIKIMSGNMLPGATVLVTSRPTALDISSKLKFDQTVEILGFTSDKIEKYVEQFCANNNKTDLKLKIWSHIESSSELKNLCYIPVNCFIVCVSLSQCLDDSKEHLPTTLTELYEVALNYFKKHHDRNQDEESYENVLKKLQQLAFNGMKNDTLIFPGQLVDKEMKESGLLHCLSNAIFEIQTQVCFIHLTVQEFLAAKHILETKKRKKIEAFISSHVKIGKWHLVLQFLAGLLRRKMKIRSDQYRSCVSVFARSFALADDYVCRLDAHQILLMKCLRETEDEDIAKETATSSALKDVTIVRCFQNILSPSDWAAVAFVCKHLSNLTRFLVRTKTLHCSVEATRLLKERCIECVELCGDLGDLGLEHLLSALMKSECHVNHQHSELTELALGANGIADSGILHLTKFLKSSHGSCIKRLKLRRNKVTPCGIAKLCEVLGSEVCGQLTELDLSDNVIGDDVVGFLCKTLIERQFKLKTLSLTRCSLTSECVPWLVKVLSDEHCEMTDLSLAGNVLRDDGVRKLCFALLNEQCNLAALDLSCCSLTHESTTALLEALGSGCALETLLLEYNEIGDEGVAMLCCAVRKDQCKLTMLSIRKCALTDKCMPSLCGALGDVHCRLTTLDLTRNAFSDKHLLLLTHTLRHQHCCLKILEFYQGDDVTEEGKRLLRDVEKSEHCKARGLKIVL